MIVTAALVWWDEPVELLRDCVHGLANTADRIIAVDGAYRRYPSGTPASPPEQAAAIRETAAELGLDCEVIVPDELWAGQVAKRAFILERAARGTDWILTSDADWIDHAEREPVRAELAQLLADGVDVVSVTYWTPPGSMAATNWHAREAQGTYFLGHFFRALPGITCERHHGAFSAEKDGRRHWIFQDFDRTYPHIPAVPLKTPYTVEHRCLTRDERRMLAGRAFCNDRIKVWAATGQEDHIDGLPEPVFDYVTVPY
jgi:hypothetical protein